MMLIHSDIEMAEELLFNYSDERWCWFGCPDLIPLQMQAAHDEYVAYQRLSYLKAQDRPNYEALKSKCLRLYAIAGQFHNKDLHYDDLELRKA